MEPISDLENSKTKQSLKLNDNSNSNLKEKDSDFCIEIFKNKILKSYKQTSVSRKMRKYFKKRYQLFSRFDSGILMDNESW